MCDLCCMILSRLPDYSVSVQFISFFRSFFCFSKQFSPGDYAQITRGRGSHLGRMLWLIHSRLSSNFPPSKRLPACGWAFFEGLTLLIQSRSSEKNNKLTIKATFWAWAKLQGKAPHPPLVTLRLPPSQAAEKRRSRGYGMEEHQSATVASLWLTQQESLWRRSVLTARRYPGVLVHVSRLAAAGYLRQHGCFSNALERLQYLQRKDQPTPGAVI